jgi:hypothetical protein
MPTDTAALIEQACGEFLWNQKDIARVIGVSLRTIQRRSGKGYIHHNWEHHRFIQAVHARNPMLADQLAVSIGTTLEALGLAPLPVPKPPPPPPAPPPLPPPGPPAARREHADAVVSAAADALNLVPREARPIVAAIFARISDLEVDLPGLVKLLKGDGAAAAKPLPKK